MFKDRAEALARILIGESGYTLKDALAKGISPGFLQVVAEANIELLFETVLEIAKEEGELACPACAEYFTIAPPVVVRNGQAFCPHCDEVLTSATCGICLEPLKSWDGSVGGDPHYVAGFSFCPSCTPEAHRQIFAR